MRLLRQTNTASDTQLMTITRRRQHCVAYKSASRYTNKLPNFGQLQQIQVIATQGRADLRRLVTSYKFAYSTDGVTYHYVTSDDDGSDRVFGGNSNRQAVVEHSLDAPIVARFVRLYPQTYFGHMALRWEVYGCSYNG